MGFFRGVFGKIVVVLLSVSLIAVAAKPVTAEETVRIGVLQTVDHEALNAVLNGFQEELAQSDFAERIQWDIQVANGDMSNLQSMSEKLARDNDVLFAIATPAAQALAVVEEEKPIFIAAVTDPVEAGLAESMENSGRNITGTSDMAPIDQQVDLLVRNFPQAKTIGIIYNSSEINSVIQAEAATELLEELGLNVEIQTVTSTNDIAQAMQAVVQKVDAMFMVTDNTIDSAIALVGDIAKEAKVPLVGSSDSVILKNGLMTLSNSYEEYGKQTAQMLIRLLEESLTPSQLPIELGKEFQIVINESFAQAIGIDPETIH